MSGFAGYPKSNAGVKGLPKAVAKAMWRDFLELKNFAAVGRKWNGRAGGTIATIFKDRGWYRPDPERSALLKKRARKAHGCFAKYAPASEAEIRRMVAELVSFRVPKGLHNEWRNWDVKKKRWLIGLLRERWPSTMPTGKFSGNVERFDYFSERAWAIARAANDGLPSRYWKVRLFPNCEGVIYKGVLHFWCRHHRGHWGAYYEGLWIEGIGRPALHHKIWEESNGPVPKGMTVIFVDGNKNNFAPENFGLRSMADCARENMTVHRLKTSRSVTAALLERHMKGKKHEHQDNIDHIIKRAGKWRISAGAGRGPGVAPVRI